MTGAGLPFFGLLKTFLTSKVAEEAQTNLANIILDSAWSSSASKIHKANITNRIKQAIFNGSKQYISSYADRHGIIKILGMMHPVWIEDIYTRVQFLDSNSIRRYQSLAELEETYRTSQKRQFQSQEYSKRNGLEVANKEQYLMVLGAPGTGKSTFLRRVGLEALKQDDSGYQHKCIPVLLELKRFNTDEVNVGEAIIQEFTVSGFPDPMRSTNQLL